MKTKTPKARVMYQSIFNPDCVYATSELEPDVKARRVSCLVIPYATAKQADKAKRWANMSYEQKVDDIARLLYRDANVQEYSWARHGKGSAEGDACEALAKRILAVTGEGPGA